MWWKIGKKFYATCQPKILQVDEGYMHRGRGVREEREVLCETKDLTSAAFPSAAINMRFSVPARRPDSCPPPRKKFGRRRPGRR